MIALPRQVESRWIKTDADRAAVEAGCYIDLSYAERVRDFFRTCLVHSKGEWAGKPFELLDWQWNDIIAPLFGWRRPDGTRRFRRAWIEVPKKNGKSTMVSGIALYMLLADGEAGAEVYSCAVDRDQAGIVFNEAANMVKKSPYLEDVIQVNASQKLMKFDQTDSKYEALASDSDSSEGKNASAVLCDEVHAWRDPAFFDSLIYSGRARRQPLFLCATTAGDDITGVGGQEHERAENVLNGSDLSQHVFVYIAAAPEVEPGDWKNPELWFKANPSLGITIPVDALAEDASEAEKSPRKLVAFQRYTLNRWMGKVKQWFTHDVWDACGEKFDPKMLEGAICYGGIDLSQKRDLSSVCWCFPVDNLFYFLWRNYIPKDLVYEKEKTDKASYQAWIDGKFLRTTPGTSIEQETIRQDILEDVGEGGSYQLAEAGYDPYNAENLCNQQLHRDSGLQMVPIQQSMSNMGPPSTELEALVKQKRIRHGGDPVVRWCIGGCAVDPDRNENIRPIKRASTTRIDPIVAMVMALGRAMANAGPRKFTYSGMEMV